MCERYACVDGMSNDYFTPACVGNSDTSNSSFQRGFFVVIVQCIKGTCYVQVNETGARVRVAKTMPAYGGSHCAMHQVGMVCGADVWAVNVHTYCIIATLLQPLESVHFHPLTVMKSLDRIAWK